MDIITMQFNTLVTMQFNRGTMQFNRGISQYYD